MATTRIISMHINKGKTIAQCLKARVDYIENPEKTNGGELISSYACSPETADQEFLLARNEYMAITGRRIHNEVIAYQLRQSFKPGEVTPEEANRIGYELASRFLKSEHAFLVATHNDRRHVQVWAQSSRSRFESWTFQLCRQQYCLLRRWLLSAILPAIS